MIEQAQEYVQNGNYPAAETLYRKMLEDEPDNPEVLFMLSIVRQAQDDLEEPVELLNHAIRSQPKNPTLYYSLGMVQLRRKQLDAAEQAFYQATGIDPNFVAAQNGIAVVELARGRFAAAEHALRKAMKTEPENPQVLVNMGIALMEQGHAGDAIGYLQQAVTAEPENLAAHMYLGRSFIAAGNTGFAIRCFENALDLSPRSREILTLLAQAELDSGQYADAISHFRRALDLAQDNAGIMQGLARSLRANGNLREAEGAFLRALRLSGNDEELLLDLASLLLEQQRYDEVIARLKGRVDEAKNVSRMTRLLADAKLHAGDASGAMDLLRPLVSEGAPSDAMRLLFARALRSGGEQDAADAQLNRLLESATPPVEAVLLRVQDLLAGDQADEAIENLRRTQRRHDLTGSQRHRVVNLLADILHRKGQYQAAWEQYLGQDSRVAEVISIRSEKPLQLEGNEPAETAMEREIAWSWPPQPMDDGRPEPVFVFGWPGAGRKELLRAVAAHSAILLVKGRQAEEPKRRLGISHPQGRGPLNAMTPAQVQLARRKYWKALRQQHPEAGNRMTIDPMALTVEAFPTIYRLFPQAHMIVLEQDPRDMAVGWLQAGYRDQESMASQYRQQLELLEKCRAGVPLNYIDVDAAMLAAKPGEMLREVISGLSLPWDGEVETAFAQSSATDLAEPGSWEHYEPWLQPVIEQF